LTLIPEVAPGVRRALDPHPPARCNPSTLQLFLVDRLRFGQFGSNLTALNCQRTPASAFLKPPSSSPARPALPPPASM